MRSFLLLLGSLVFAMSLNAAQAADTAKPAVEIKDPENTLLLDLAYGQVVIQMRPDLAPNHVARIKELVRKKFYDGVVFHRVIEGFMAQTGDPTGTGMGGSGQKLKAEFTKEPFKRGVVGMARGGDPDSGDSQFFIMFDNGEFLNNKYTVWGTVISGMEFVDKIKRGEPPSDPDKIVKLQVAADVTDVAKAQ
jgi:peptidylprolyl isomerase